MAWGADGEVQSPLEWTADRACCAAADRAAQTRCTSHLPKCGILLFGFVDLRLLVCLLPFPDLHTPNCLVHAAALRTSCCSISSTCTPASTASSSGPPTLTWLPSTTSECCIVGRGCAHQAPGMPNTAAAAASLLLLLHCLPLLRVAGRTAMSSSSSSTSLAWAKLPSMPPC